MFDRAESDLDFWYNQRDALLGISSSGVEGLAQSVWDQARAARASGLWIDTETGTALVVRRPRSLENGSGMTAFETMAAVARARRIELVMQETPATTKELLHAAFATARATPLVANVFNTDACAPLVGLGLMMWYEMKPEDRRAPAAVVDAWDAALKSNAGHALLRPVKRRTVDVYHSALGVYDEVRRYVARQRGR